MPQGRGPNLSHCGRLIPLSVSVFGVPPCGGRRGQSRLPFRADYSSVCTFCSAFRPPMDVWVPGMARLLQRLPREHNVPPGLEALLLVLWGDPPGLESRGRMVSVLVPSRGASAPCTAPLVLPTGSPRGFDFSASSPTPVITAWGFCYLGLLGVFFLFFDGRHPHECEVPSFPSSLVGRVLEHLRRVMSTRTLSHTVWQVAFSARPVTSVLTPS